MQTQTTYTPGPWEAFYSDGGFRDGSSGWVLEATRNVGCHATIRGCGPREDEANARLIAAAPDLLEAARDALAESHWQHSATCPAAAGMGDPVPGRPKYDPTLCDVTRCVPARLRAAIAKATGDATV